MELVNFSFATLQVNSKKQNKKFPYHYNLLTNGMIKRLLILNDKI